jgi:putative MATE family efflux protein
MPLVRGGKGDKLENTPILSENTKRLGTAPLGRLILSLSLPGMVSMVTIALYNIIDTFWVAKLGHEAIAALTVILPYNIIVIAIAAGTGVGIGSLTSRRFGEGNIEATNHAAGQIFPISFVLGILCLALAVFLPRPLLTMFGATPDIMDYGRQYLVIIGFGLPFAIFSIPMNDLLRASGDALRPMIFMLTAAIINIVLDPLFIFGIGPFPEMGVRGAATATVIGQVVGAGMGFFYIVARRSTYRIQPRHLVPSLQMIRDIYRVGLPSMIIEVTESLTFILLNNVLSAFGSMAIAAVGITIRIVDFAFMPIIGVAQGLLPIVGYNFGARLWKRLWGAVKTASVYIAVFMGAAQLLMEIFTPQLIGIFSTDAELLGIAVPAMRIAIAAIVLIAPTILFIATFQGLAKGKAVLFLSLARQLVFFVPFLYLLPRFLGIYGVWMALPISDTMGFIVAGLWLLREYRIQKRTHTWDAIPGTGNQ